MKGVISLEGLTFFAYHGFHPEEQKLGNQYEVDVYIDQNYSAGSITDNLEDTVDYEKVYAIVSTVMQKQSQLLEFLAGAIVSELKEKLSIKGTIRVKISKLNPPVGGVCQRASFELVG